MYDIIDDFPAFSWAPKDSRELEKVLLQRSDCIITGTLALEKMHRATRPDARFIPCGVDFDLFHTPQIKPTMLEHVTKPIIGYFGTISERIDISLLKLIESEIPEASLVLIGPVHLGTSDLPHSSRIYYPGLIPHNQLAGFAQQFSVAIIPFCITEATNKLNPVKTLEYMAAGVPVVSTALPDIVQLFASYVSVAMDHEEFIAHIRRILKTPPVDQISAASKLARESSWQAMTDRILEFLEGTSRASIK
jgi:glycosyltransferase involved in cell wall biosynthesis